MSAELGLPQYTRTTGPAQRPEWLERFLREAGVRRGIILYGNIRDRFFHAPTQSYLSLPELLLTVLEAERRSDFTLRGLWDRADGLRFPDSRSRRRFDDALQRSMAAPERAAEGSSQASDYDLGETSPGPGLRPDGARAEAPGDGLHGTGAYPEPGEFLPALRAVLAQPGERPAVILDWSHLLVTQPAHPDQDERRWLLHLGKALVGEPGGPLDSDRLRQPQGLIVLLAASLGSLPPVLYQGEPRVCLIAVPAPARVERRDFFLRHLDDLRVERPRPMPGRAASSGAPATLSLPGAKGSELADSLAERTDQLGLVDLQQILRLAQRTPTPLSPERLLNLYRFGDQRSPWEELSEQRLLEVERELGERVIGQDSAVRHVATMILRAHLGLAGLQASGRSGKPKGVLFFVGPTGVGKTELAKACAAFLFGDESACLRFDMSEYNHEHSDQRLVGAPPGYVGFEEGGQLTNAVRQRPFSVLLFDEIEKAHPRVLDKFLQILEDGRLTDGRGETTLFSESVIIFTSNIGAASLPRTDDAQQRADHFHQAVEHHFVQELRRPELLNRLGDNVVVFDLIHDAGVRRAILVRKLEPLRAHLRERFGVELEISLELEQRYVGQARADHGGRGLVNVLERDLLNPLSRFLFRHSLQLRAGRRILATVEHGQVELHLEDRHG